MKTQLTKQSRLELMSASRFCIASAMTAILALQTTGSTSAFSRSSLLVSSSRRQSSQLIHISLLKLHSTKRTTSPRVAFVSDSPKKVGKVPKVPYNGRISSTPDTVHPMERIISIEKPNPTEIESFDPFYFCSSKETSEDTIATPTIQRPRGYVQEVTVSSYDEQNQQTPVGTSNVLGVQASSKPSAKPFHPLSELWKARFLVLAAAALYGTNFTIVKILQEQLPFAASTSLRFTMASLATLPFLLPSLSPTSPVTDAVEGSIEKALTSWGDILPVVLTGMEVGLYNAMGYIFQASGLETVDASKSAFICSLAVVTVPILDFLLKKKSLSFQSIAGLICAVLGVGLLELNGDSLSLTLGDLFTFAQPLFFGIGFWKMEQAMEKHPTQAKRITASQVLMVAICSVANCWLLQPHIGAEVQAPSLDQIMAWLSDPKIFSALAWTGLVTTALTQYMETVALKTISASEATLLFSTEPLWGAGFAHLVVGERLGLSAAAGAGLILSGCAISTVQKNDPSEAGKDSTAVTVVADAVSDPYKFSAGLASLALQVQVSTAVEEAVQENEIVVQAESSLYDSAVGAVSEAMQSNVFDDAVGQLQTLVDALPPST